MEAKAWPPRPGRPAGFTLIELIVAGAVLAVILLLTLQLTGGASGIWQRTRARIDTFQEGRKAFETVTAGLSQATLNVYLDYVDASGKTRGESGWANFTPARYARASELQFTSGPAEELLPGVVGLDGQAVRPTSHAVFFQAPLGRTATLGDHGGTAQLLSACGYYLEYSGDRAERPLFLRDDAALPERRRFRLVEFVEPAERLEIYRPAGQGGEWFRRALAKAPAGDRRVLADNVVALVVLPQFSPWDPLAQSGQELAPDYAYDSRRYLSETSDLAARTRNQLPPLVRVTMVCVDEKSMARIEQRNGSAPPDFGVDRLFRVSRSEEGYGQDLETLKKELVRQRVTYRVFSALVSIAQAKWDR